MTESEARTEQVGKGVGGERRVLGWTLLGAAVLLPAVCYYLSKQLWSNRKPLRAYLGPPQKASKEEPPTPIKIPVTVVEETATDAPPADDATRTVALAPTTSAPAVTVAFVGSTESDKFHHPSCRWAQNIQDAHRLVFATREAALAEGRVPCGTCAP